MARSALFWKVGHLPRPVAREVEGKAWLPDGRLVLVSLGVLVGLGTGAALWAHYPPAPNGGWIPTTAIGLGSAILVLAVWVTLRLMELPTASDWFVMGYAGAVLLLASADIVPEALTFLHTKAPGVLGSPLTADGSGAGQVPYLSVGSGVLLSASYALWTLGAPRRLCCALVLGGLALLAVAAGEHGNWIGAPPPAQAPPSTTLAG